MDDRQLVEAARRGNDRAFAVLVRTHEHSRYCTAYSILGSSWNANDAVQDTFLEAYARIDTLRDAGSFRPWLGRILVNGCYDALGRRRRLVPVGESPTTPAEIRGDRPGRTTAPAAHTLLGTEALESYIAGDLDDLETSRVAEHLAACPACAVAYEDTRLLVGELKDLRNVFQPSHVFEEVPDVSAYAGQKDDGPRERSRGTRGTPPRRS